jgi:hypothetical protein
MNGLQTAYINALLADASYETVLPGEVDADDLEKRLTSAQAAFLAANFRVLDTYNAMFGGLNAVVWEIKAGSELALANPGDAGKVFVSMRGTQEPVDFLNDGQLAVSGIPYQQVADMVNWWQRATASRSDNQVKQIAVSTAINTFVAAPNATGTGTLHALPANLQVDRVLRLGVRDDGADGKKRGAGAASSLGAQAT